MSDPNSPLHKLINTLEEHTKELSCLYQVEELLGDRNANLKELGDGIVRVIPGGMQYPEQCRARIVLGDAVSSGDRFVASALSYESDIVVQDEVVGSLAVCYIKTMPPADEGPFLRSEIKLIAAIADIIGHFLLHQKLRRMAEVVALAKVDLEAISVGGWRIVVNLIGRTDHDLFHRISRKMINHLCWKGIHEAEGMLQRFGLDRRTRCSASDAGDNRPLPTNRVDQMALGEEIFEVAARHLDEEEILRCVQKWILEDRSGSLVRTLINPGSSHTDVYEAIRRFNHLTPSGAELTESIRKSIKVALVDRFLSSQLEFIKIAKNYVDINDFFELIQQLICAPSSHGALGGKGAGLFLASRIIRKISETYPELRDIKVPKTWYVTADGMFNFLHYNNIEDVAEQKYKPMEQVRQEYPNIIYTFKNSYFPPAMIQGFCTALDDFGDAPLIVRSSSLLEDRYGATFSGKYISLFLANQGTKEARLEALMDAIAEVYASVFDSDPIEYRAERGLLDFNEEMGVLIQEVVGTRVGKYYLPSFAGVAFSNNEFRWSPRIKRGDGLVRLVVGLGTRAVDRLSDDYTVLVAPGQPNLQVNASPEERIRYSPRRIDLINLETNAFETVDIKTFLQEYGEQLPGVWNMVSVVRDGHIRQGSAFNINFDRDDVIVTFDGLFTKTPFLRQIKAIMNQLQATLGTPVDIEFAADSRNFYLLQCRPQGYSPENNPAPIPKETPRELTLFTARRYVSNGFVPEITHIVYVSPQKYSELDHLDVMLEIGRAVGRLNQALPKRRFILMGPGRWGSRGDIRLGVNVTYSDINNTAMLIEIGRKKGNYVPDLSFGTHFFQDLVEAQIRYLPLYPDDEGIIFNEEFLASAPNILQEILPDYAHLQDSVRVIDVPRATAGKVLKVFMNAEIEEALGIFAAAASA